MSGRDHQKREAHKELHGRSSSQAVARSPRTGTNPPHSTERLSDSATDPPMGAGYAERDEREFDSLSDELNRWPDTMTSPRALSRGSGFEPALPRVDEPFLDEAAGGSRTDSEPVSTGYYSLRSSPDDVVIPPAPRVPTLDLDSIEAIHATSSFSSAKARGGPYSQPPEGRDAETIRTPAPGSFGSFAPPASQWGSDRERERADRFTSAPPSSSDNPQSRRTRLYLAPHLRMQADRWLSTGSLSLPGCSSDRHSRALQRALLLAMLHQPGWEMLPQGLKERVQRLFCDGWESNAGVAHPFREIDDLATVLGIACTREARAEIAQAINGHLPATFPRGRTSRPPAGTR